MESYDGKILIKNYKCFDSSGCGFDKLMPINIIIGKNNSGKSSLIDLIRFIVNKDQGINNLKRDGKPTEIIIGIKIDEHIVNEEFKHDLHNLRIHDSKVWQYITSLHHNEIYCRFNGASFILIKQNIQTGRNIDMKLASIVNKANKPLSDKFFFNITAERDINPEKNEVEIKLEPNGLGATNLIQQIINSNTQNSSLIERHVLKELNTIINPDIYFSRILVQRSEDGLWEVFFEDEKGVRVALSKMGSGVKTIILVLLNLIALVSLRNKPKDSCVFAFEELENNLHPSLQRKLYDYIKRYSESNGAIFFITTHSNIVIDTFGTDEKSQLIHIKNDREKSTTKTILSNGEAKNILVDLGVKASELLQSNGIIWVEGPSDRNYINKWLSLKAPKLKEGLHYSIMFYGGRLLANISFDYDKLESDLIPMLKINTNAFVVIDRDGKRIKARLNKTKERVSKEIGQGKFWVTKGREIENYLSEKVIIKWLERKTAQKEIKFKNEANTKLEDNIKTALKSEKLIYNRNKTIFSSEISRYIDTESLQFLDLEKQIKILIDEIKRWNHIE